MKILEDVIWNLKLIFTARRWLRINVPLYVQRVVDNSFSRRKRTPEQTITVCTSSLTAGLEYLDEFIREQKFFEQNPDARLPILKFFFDLQLNEMSEAFKELKPQEVYEIFKHDFSKAGSSQTALISLLLVTTNLYRNGLIK